MSILKEAKAGLNDDVFNLVLIYAGYGKKCFQCGKNATCRRGYAYQITTADGHYGSETDIEIIFKMIHDIQEGGNPWKIWNEKKQIFKEFKLTIKNMLLILRNHDENTLYGVVEKIPDNLTPLIYKLALKKYIKYTAEDFFNYKQLMRDGDADDTDGQPVKILRTAKTKSGTFYTEIMRDVKIKCFFRNCGMD